MNCQVLNVYKSVANEVHGLPSSYNIFVSKILALLKQIFLIRIS